MEATRRTALAAVTSPDGRTSLGAYPIPEVTADTGLLRVLASGVCGTDVSLVRTGSLRRPTVLGHHVVGRVQAVGQAAVRRWEITPGDLVAVQEYLPCRSCRWCRTGEFRLCDRADIRQRGRRFGTVPVSEPPGLWGGNAELLHLPPETIVHRLPDAMPPSRAVWLLPLANAFDWTLEAGRLRPGETVVIIGPGQHGLSCVVAATEHAAGTVVVVGAPGDEERLAIAEQLGADYAIVAAGDDGMTGAVLERLGGAGADVVINTSGVGPELMPSLVAVAGKHARIVEAGLADGEVPALDLAAVTTRALAIVGARGRSLTAVDRAVVSLDTAGGAHPLDAVPTGEISLDQIDDVLRPDLPQRRPRLIHTVVRPAGADC